MAQKRLSKEEARDLILGSAQNLFESKGLEGLKLADIAKDAGITHSNILHHFGSREGLNEALIERMTTRLALDILENIEQTDHLDRTANLRILFDTLSQKSYAQLITWVLAMGSDQEREDRLIKSLRPLFERLNQEVLKRQKGAGTLPEEQGLRFFMLLITTAAVGEGVAGNLLKQSIQVDGTKEEYRAWLADMFKPR